MKHVILLSIISGRPLRALMKWNRSGKLNYRREEGSEKLRSYTFLMHSADLVTFLAKGRYEEDGLAGMYSKALTCRVD